MAPLPACWFAILEPLERRGVFPAHSWSDDYSSLERNSTHLRGFGNSDVGRHRANAFMHAYRRGEVAADAPWVCADGEYAPRAPLMPASPEAPPALPALPAVAELRPAASTEAPASDVADAAESTAPRAVVPLGRDAGFKSTGLTLDETQFTPRERHAHSYEAAALLVSLLVLVVAAVAAVGCAGIPAHLTSAAVCWDRRAV